MTELSSKTSNRKMPLGLAILLWIFLVGLMGWARLILYAHSALPIGYSLAIALFGPARRRAMLWSMLGVFVAMATAKFFFINIEPYTSMPLQDREVHLAMTMAEMLVVTLVVDLLICSYRTQESAGAVLERKNQELSASREEIQRQNEELQAQSEELERQSQELRLANDEQSRRQHVLEATLALSRSHTPDMPRSEIFRSVFSSLQRLIPSVAAAALWQRSGDEFTAVLHEGLAPTAAPGPKTPATQSFSSLILQQDRTGYIEDISVRKDLRLPAAPGGADSFKAVLATPLRISGGSMQCLEIYCTAAQLWTADQVILAQSLAAQLSASLTSADLFSQLDDQRRQLTTILETVPFGISIVEVGAKRIHFNPAGAALLGVSPEMQGENFGWPKLGKIFINGQELANDQYTTVRALRGQASGPQELELRFHDGRRIFILSAAAPIRDREGNITAAVAAFIDLRSQKELRDELDRRRADAEEASARKSRFLSAASHDIRTPANAIGLLGELIQRCAADPEKIGEIAELAQDLRDNTMGLLNLITDVLDVTRLDLGRIELNVSEFDFNDWLVGECRQLGPLAEAKKLDFQCVPLQPPVRLRGDRVKLSRVLVNLAGNAIKFTEHGQVRVWAQRLGNGSLKVVVHDTGIGIAPEHQGRIFDEYAQLKQSSPDRAGGSGLGLSICKRLIELMGGSLELVSASGKGSDFTFILPPSAVVG